MAKKNGKTKKSGLLGPLYSAPDGYELGPHRVEGPKGGKSVPDPMGFGHGKLGHGPSPEGRKGQTHEKD